MLHEQQTTLVLMKVAEGLQTCGDAICPAEGLMESDIYSVNSVASPEAIPFEVILRI